MEKSCQNCNQSFEITPEDQDFYSKINVPLPTFCPECRLIRRMTWRNERSLYKNTCKLCSKNIISMYSKEKSFPVYCKECWYSDKWNAEDYRKKYDWTITFFKQWYELSKKVPQIALLQIRTNTNCEYANYIADNKDCYLVYSMIGNENVLYSCATDHTKDSLDNSFTKNSQYCYENISCSENFRGSYMQESKSCLNSSFLYNCVNCDHCTLSANLRNKKYVFQNIQCTKEEYLQKIETLKLDTITGLARAKDRFRQDVCKKAIRKYATITKSTNAYGNNIENCKNARECFEAYNCENITRCVRATGVKDAMDVYGIAKCELIYESVAPGLDAYNQKFAMMNDASKDLQYSWFCKNCSNCFGCIGLKNKSYCILNAQYTKETYESLLPRVINHMNTMIYKDNKERTYAYGEFFPTELSPFSYNETIAQEYFPLTKKEAEKKSLAWKDKEERSYNITKTSEHLPDSIEEVSDSIINEIIECVHKGECSENCTTAFRIIPQELKLYRELHLPLPRLCPNCRHYERQKQRNPLKLWERQCMCEKKNHNHQNKCENTFHTTYQPDRPEIIYCEQCYQTEII